VNRTRREGNLLIVLVTLRGNVPLVNDSLGYFFVVLMA
jgi:hypothetical protein